MNCPDYRPFHGPRYRQAPSSCRSTAKSPQRRSPAPAAAMASAASGSGGRGSDERDGQRNGRSAASDDPRRRTRQQLRSRRAGRRSGAAGEHGGPPRHPTAARPRPRGLRHAPAPEGCGAPPPKAAVPAPPKAAVHHLRGLRCQRPPPHGGRHSPSSQSPPPQPMEPVAGTSSGYSPFFHDVNGSFANLRQTTTHRRPSPQLFRPKSPMRPCRPAITGSKGYSDPASDAKYGAFLRCCRANRHFATRRQPSAVRS